MRGAKQLLPACLLPAAYLELDAAVVRCVLRRGMTGQQARAVCPELQIVQASAVRAPAHTTARDAHLHTDCCRCTPTNLRHAQWGCTQVPVSHGKADLTIYRAAGGQVASILARLSVCERASIDEVRAPAPACFERSPRHARPCACPLPPQPPTPHPRCNRTCPWRQPATATGASPPVRPPISPLPRCVPGVPGRDRGGHAAPAAAAAQRRAAPARVHGGRARAGRRGRQGAGHCVFKRLLSDLDWVRSCVAARVHGERARAGWRGRQGAGHGRVSSCVFKV